MRPGDIFIEEEIPAIHRANFPKAICDAYKAVDALVAETPFLQCPPAKQADGHLVTWAVDFAVWQLIETGKWPVEHYDWAWFKKPTGRYLRIFTKRSIVTISQLADDSQQPRHAEFRANAAYDEQIPLLLLPGEKELIISGRTHLLLAHGHQNLQFIYLAMPNPEKKPAWLGRSSNLINEIHDISANLSPAEGPKEIDEQTINIKEQLKKQLRDHGS
jgi:hypothetical protein